MLSQTLTDTLLNGLIEWAINFTIKQGPTIARNAWKQLGKTTNANGWHPPLIATRTSLIGVEFI